jgi:predicted regulator of Ras-like GTPase activity (Roadblock/LC7/MglB family)
LLQEIALLPGVIGSLIVAPDGTLVASTFPKWYDSPSIAVSALGIFMSSEHVIMKLGHDRLMLISLKSTATNTLIAELSPGLDAGLLVIVTADNHDLPWLEPLRLLFARVTA